MEFGKIGISELEHIQFKLPSDPPQNKSVLSNLKLGKPKMFIGCAKWGRKDWIGKFYPPGTKEKDFFSYYAKLFNCIELNATYYKTPTSEQIKKWRDNVDENFKFCPKFPQIITHMKRLKNCDREVDEFLRVIVQFENNLGPVFLMPHPQMGLKSIDIVKQFIESLPKDLDLFLELRNPEWFINGFNEDMLTTVLTNNIGLVISDAAGRRDCVHMYLSKPETFIRFVGNSLHQTDYTRIDEWAERLKLWVNEGLQTVYFFMHQHEELHSPELSKYLIEQLNTKMDLSIPVPHLLNENKLQQRLFD